MNMDDLAFKAANRIQFPVTKPKQNARGSTRKFMFFSFFLGSECNGINRISGTLWEEMSRKMPLNTPIPSLLKVKISATLWEEMSRKRPLNTPIPSLLKVKIRKTMVYLHSHSDCHLTVNHDQKLYKTSSFLNVLPIFSYYCDNSTHSCFVFYIK